MDDKIANAKPKYSRPEDDPTFDWENTELGKQKAGPIREMELHWDAKPGELQVTDPLAIPGRDMLGVIPIDEDDATPTLRTEDSPHAKAPTSTAKAPSGKGERWQVTDNIGEVEVEFTVAPGDSAPELLRSHVDAIQDITEVAPGVYTVRLTTGKFKRLRVVT